ncbi:sulfatase [Puniceicoccales bacterium CK1056]|uniref:Sulfatase n=1 Tax=Oceanipulchritudo coccoides TaxID=2706888 RepID=A0A6B2M4J4_9BACT|nr:sulfatase [Oceanipulchritudo coccoides]NDV63202.1 sulfatase [Oceanipulchritudo coccoides]
MKNRILSVAGLLVAGALFANRPNVLFIAVDDLKPMLGTYGYEQVKSPRIDKLSEQGVVFLNAACQFPVCGPSRASIMTGLRPETTGVLNLKTKMRDVNPDVLTLPQHFKNNGYVTAGVGKIFDPRCVDSRNQGDEISWTFPYDENPSSTVPSMPKSREVVQAYDLPDEAFPDGRIFRGAVEKLRKMAEQEEPFFLAVGFKKPHLPFVAPQRFFDLYDPETIQLASFQERAQDNSGYGYWDSKETRGYDGVPDKGDIPDTVQRQMIHGYLACISWIDTLVGQLLEELEATGKAQNTIVVLWGDHGFHLGDHGLWGKHTPFEEAVRAPLIIVDPRVGKPVKTVSPVEFTDVFPTLCDLAGLELPERLQGVSLVACLEDESAKPREVSTSIYKSRGAFGYSVRNERYRYIEWISNKGANLVGRDLFDFEADPLGKVNFAKHKDYQDVVKELSDALHAESHGWKLLQRSLD